MTHAAPCAASSTHSTAIQYFALVPTPAVAPLLAEPEATRAFAEAVRPLLAGAVDYAGLFPPAGLAMTPVVRHYAAYRRGHGAARGARALLGRLVVPVARLEEFEAAALDLLPTDDSVAAGDAPWRLSALAGTDLGGDLARAAAFNARHATNTGAGRAVVDAVEWKADALAALAGAAALRARHLPNAACYAELPAGADAAAFAAAAQAHGLGLKLRTGGVTPDAFPAPDAVLAFLAAVATGWVPAKATAGLHHALPGEHPLTDEPGCARGAMYGFVNVLLAGALLRAGHAPAAVAPLLAERDPAAFSALGGAPAWRGLAAPAAGGRPSTRALDGFGSCAFEEPAAELRALGWWLDDTT